MELLSLLGVMRLASPVSATACFRNAHVCMLTLAQQYGLVCATHEVAAAQQVPPHHRNPDGKTDDQAAWKIPVDKEILSFSANSRLPSNRHPEHQGETRSLSSCPVLIMESSLPKLRTYIPN